MNNYDMEDTVMPCLYNLSFLPRATPFLEIEIYGDFVESCKEIIPSIFVRHLQEGHMLGEFSPLGGSYFGFDSALKRAGRDSGEFIVYRIEPPLIRKETSVVCGRCHGSGWDDGLDQKCLWCEGGGYETSFEWKPLYAISASLQILSSLFGSSLSSTSNSNRRQILTFQVRCGKGQGDYPIGGCYGVDFCKWLTSLPTPQYQLSLAIKAMEQIYSCVYGKTPGIINHFQAYVEPDAFLVLTCPGDACGLNPVGSYWYSGHGRPYGCHNLDNPAQQLMLLGGLGVLSDMAREYIWETVL